MKAATSQVETGAKKIGSGQVGEGVEQTAKGVGKTVEEGAKYTGEKLKEAGKAAEPEAKSAGRSIKDGAVSFGSEREELLHALFGIGWGAPRWPLWVRARAALRRPSHPGARPGAPRALDLAERASAARSLSGSRPSRR